MTDRKTDLPQAFTRRLGPATSLTDAFFYVIIAVLLVALLASTSLSWWSARRSVNGLLQDNVLMNSRLVGERLEHLSRISQMFARLILATYPQTHSPVANEVDWINELQPDAFQIYIFDRSGKPLAGNRHDRDTVRRLAPLVALCEGVEDPDVFRLLAGSGRDSSRQLFGCTTVRNPHGSAVAYIVVSVATAWLDSHALRPVGGKAMQNHHSALIWGGPKDHKVIYGNLPNAISNLPVWSLMKTDRVPVVYQDANRSFHIASSNRLPKWPLLVAWSVPKYEVASYWWTHGARTEFVLTFGLLGIAFLAHRSKKKARSEKILRLYHTAVSDVNRVVAERPDPTALYRRVCAALAHRVALPLVWVGSLDPDSGKIQILTSAGCASLYVKELDITTDCQSPIQCHFAARAINDRRIVMVDNLEVAPNSDRSSEALRHFGLRSAIAAPFTQADGSSGVICAYAYPTSAFENSAFQLMTNIAQGIELGLRDHRHVENITRLSLTDSLTGLPNRAHYTSTLQHALARADRSHTMVAVCILDLDNFKDVNDSYGHPVGDELLNTVAGRLRGAMRAGDKVARLGGDEFGLIVEGVERVCEVNALADRVLQVLQTPVRLQSVPHTAQAGASLGFTLYPIDDGSTDDLVRHADAALYKAKTAGRNQAVMFDQSFDIEAQHKYRLRTEFPAALEDRTLELHYQPQIDLVDGTIVGAEALIRWPAEDGSYISPSAFMPLVEADPVLIRSLGRYVLAQAISTLEEWHKGGRLLRLSVNIGAQHILHPEFMADLNEALALYPDAAHSLTVELTETADIEDLDQCAAIFEKIRMLGIRTALDDFGTGYSSLRHVQKLPLDEIKLDVQFVQHLETDVHAFSIGYAAVKLARIANATVVAEGVEDTRVARLWARLGGRIVQGYAFAAPMSAACWTAWIAGYRLPEGLSKIPSWLIPQRRLAMLRALADNRRFLSRLVDAMGCADSTKGRKQNVATVMSEWRLSASVLHSALHRLGAPLEAVRHVCKTQAMVLKHAEAWAAGYPIAYSSHGWSSGELPGSIELAMEKLCEVLDALMEDVDRGLGAEGAAACAS